MRACARTTQGGIRRIRTGGCAAIGPLARNRPSDPKAPTSLQSTKPVTEAEAIRLAQAGDAAAFEFLYRLHSRRVYALCLRMVNNPSDAEVLMRLRKKSLPLASLEETTDPDDETGGPRKDIGAPDLRLSGAVDRVNLERSVEKLPPGYRTVFVLHDVQGYEHNEIAEIMGCSVGNSKSQLHKARTRLRDLLQEELRAQARQERHAARSQTAHDD